MTFTEVLADEIRSRGTFVEEGLSIADQVHQRGILGEGVTMYNTEEIHVSSSPTAQGTIHGEHMASPTIFTSNQSHPDPLKDADNLEGRYPMQPADEHPQDRLLSSQSCYQVLNFDKVVNAESVLQITDGCHDHAIMIRVMYAVALVLKVTILLIISCCVVKSQRKDHVYVHRPKYGTQLRR